MAGEVEELARTTTDATADITAKVHDIRAAAAEEQTATTTEINRSVVDASASTQAIVATTTEVNVAAAETTTRADSVSEAAQDLSPEPRVSRAHTLTMPDDGFMGAAGPYCRTTDPG